MTHINFVNQNLGSTIFYTTFICSNISLVGQSSGLATGMGSGQTGGWGSGQTGGWGSGQTGMGVGQTGMGVGQTGMGIGQTGMGVGSKFGGSPLFASKLRVTSTTTSAIYQ